MNLRIFANAYNLFTITGVKFVDPEHPDDDLGRMYPLNKTYTVGMSLSVYGFGQKINLKYYLYEKDIYIIIV